MIKKLVIVGGGTAGWMAASLMAARWSKLGIEISVIESADIGAIGVGEGSTPFLKDFFSYLNIPESQWMPKCNATYKASIEFVGWSTKPGFEAYSHPFPSELDSRTCPVFKYNSLARRQGADVHAHPDRFLLGAHVAKNKSAPAQPEHFPFHLAYGYHFDSVLLGDFLRERVMNLGVKRIETEVVNTEKDEQGNIKSLITKKGETITGDFFVDCTGFTSLLLQKALNVPFVNYEDNLFNDGAIALPTPIDKQIPAQTTSTALKNGWAWKIPLTNRFGNGYVYSSKYCSADEAETELRQHTGTLDKDIDVKRLKFKLGRLSQAWSKNCVAIGLSQGFIEPLEATALDLIQTTVQEFIDAFETGEFTNQKQNEFNDSLNYRYERVRDYIVMHYHTNSRNDSDYWRDCRKIKSFSPAFIKMHKCWMTGDDFDKVQKDQKITAFDSTSWHCLLGGMGVYPENAKLKKNSELEKYNLQGIDDFIRRCAMNYIDHKKVLSRFN